MAHMPLGPGPGAYALPPTVGYEKHDARKQRMPQYSFGARTNQHDGPGDAGPGPGAYKVDKLTRFGKDYGIQYTMGVMTRIVEKREGPGPGAYDVQDKPFLTGVNAPAYSITSRNEYGLKKDGPGPNVYKYDINLIRPAAPAYSMGIQGKTLTRMEDSPGPAAYGAGNLNIKCARAPEFSISPRYKSRMQSVGPGPNYYDLQYYRPGKSGNAYSFGVRHSPYAPPMVVRCDNM